MSFRCRQTSDAGLADTLSKTDGLAAFRCSIFLGDTVLPVARLAATMRNRDDKYKVSFDSVQNGVREETS